MRAFSRTISLICMLIFLTSSISFCAENITQLHKTNAFINYLNTTYSSQFVKLQDLRISPVIKSKECEEIPWEAGILTPENQIAPDLQKIAKFNNSGDILITSTINVSISAQRIAATGQPILSMTLEGKLYSGVSSSISFVKQKNDKLINVFLGLLKTTTFTPQVKKKVDKSDIKLSGKHWVTNVRIDSDGRIQITGYGLNLKSITKLTEDLQNTGYFEDIFINSLCKNSYEKVPVWRFDMTAKL